MKHLVLKPRPGNPWSNSSLSAFRRWSDGRSLPGKRNNCWLREACFRIRSDGKTRPSQDLAPSSKVFWPDLPVTEFTLDPARVIWQDEHLLVVDKPAGVNTAPSPFSDIDCLTWGVFKFLGGRFPIHAVHRLDRDTQGLGFFAKTKPAEVALHQMFRNRAVRKVYRALTPPWTEGLTPSVYRWRDTLDWRGRVQSASTTAVAAGTDDQGRRVWMVLPHTGRPHQIRRHFARYAVPLWAIGFTLPESTRPMRSWGWLASPTAAGIL